jgi:7,8-dihydroneopterin aldolase/epimerase/oxygenase
MDHILIEELEVSYRVGVPDLERATPQRLLLNLDIRTDLASAAASDDLGQTIDYFALTRRLLALGKGRSWKLIEKLAVEIAELVLTEFQAAAVEVEVRKFIVPETRYVAVRVARSRTGE